MADNAKLENNEDVSMSDEEKALVNRRDFLVGLKKWSAIVIGGVVLGGALPTQETRAAWVNGGGGAWVNGRGGWVNGGGGSAGWVNRSGGWINGGGGGAGWVNRSGGGSSGWVNSRGGGGGAWVNRRY
jgi:hypothetical protein